MIITTFCMMTACLNEAEYLTAWQRIATLIKPGGFLLAAEALEEESNTVGVATFSSIPITMTTVRESLSLAGFQIIQSIEDTFSEDGPKLGSNEKWHFTIAKKI